MTDEPLAHIRRPNPPWRDDALTECGKPETSFAKVISGDEAVALVKKHGIQRAAFLLCQTCMSTASRHCYGGYGRVTEPQDWRRDPVAVLHRYLDRVRWSRDQIDPVRHELHAIGMLVEAHREEFDAILAGMNDAGDLSAKRAAKNYFKQSRA